MKKGNKNKLIIKMLHKAINHLATQNLAKTRVISGALKGLSIVTLPMIMTSIRGSHS